MASLHREAPQGSSTAAMLLQQVATRVTDVAGRLSRAGASTPLVRPVRLVSCVLADIEGQRLACKMMPLDWEALSQQTVTMYVVKAFPCCNLSLNACSDVGCSLQQRWTMPQLPERRPLRRAGSLPRFREK